MLTKLVLNAHQLRILDFFTPKNSPTFVSHSGLTLTIHNMPTFVLSDSSLNKYGFRTLTSGAKLDQFKKNPVMLFMHDRRLMPIGKWVNIRIEGDRLVADTEFDMDDEFAATISAKVDKGYLKMASVGFDVIAYSEDPKDMVPGQRRPTVTKWEPFEASIVDIGANNAALKLRDQLRGITLAGGDAIDEHDLDILLPTIQQTPSMKKLALRYGLAEDATEDQILAAAEAAETKLKAEAKPITAKTDKQKQVELLMQLGAAKGFITADNKESYEKLAADDFDTVEKLVNNAKAAKTEATSDRLADVLEKLNAGGGTNTPDANDRTKWTLTDWRKKDEKGLGQLKASDPAKYQKLVADFEATKK
jgi:HK97 family phage prohead protease